MEGDVIGSQSKEVQESCFKYATQVRNAAIHAYQNKLTPNDQRVIMQALNTVLKVNKCPVPDEMKRMFYLSLGKSPLPTHEELKPLEWPIEQMDQDSARFRERGITK